MISSYLRTCVHTRVSLSFCAGVVLLRVYHLAFVCLLVCSACLCTWFCFNPLHFVVLCFQSMHPFKSIPACPSNPTQRNSTQRNSTVQAAMVAAAQAAHARAQRSASPVPNPYLSTSTASSSDPHSNNGDRFSPVPFFGASYSATGRKRRDFI